MIKAVYICDHCKKEFEDPIPSATTICVTPDLYLQLSVRHNHCAYDMCEKCRAEVVRTHVQKLDRSNFILACKEV